MPPKGAKQQNAQKKAEQKVKQKIVEDKTFGLKNKNKSKTVQKMVQTMQASVTNQNKRKTGPAPAEARKERRAEEEARKEELRKLFGTVDDKKKKKEDDEQGGADDPYAELKGGEEDYLWTAEDFEPVELEEGRLEEQLERELEELRERLATQGGGTKVNEDSFQRWKEQKRREKEEEEKKKRTRALRTGQMTGRMLYEHNQSIFVDDDEGVEEYERQDEEPADGASGAIDSSLFSGEDLPGDDDDEDGEGGEDGEEDEEEDA